jgi:hypothetical protein
VAKIPPAYEAGRLIGAAIGAMLIARCAVPDADAPVPVRVRRIALAAVLYGVTWWGASAAGTLLAEPYRVFAVIVAGALPAAVLLPGPLYIESRVSHRN